MNVMLASLTPEIEGPDLDRLVALTGRLAGRLDCSFAEAVDRLEQAALAQSRAPASERRFLRAVQRARASRNERLGVDLFRDPGWDMLLELVAGQLDGRPIAVSSLCFAAGVPATTALRHIDRMMEEGLIVRTGDFGDQRRVLIAIAPARRAEVEALLRSYHAAVCRAEGGGDGAPPPPRIRPPA